ncbi:MAG: DUF5704 domain-containing protein [Lachnoclostridium sp.]|jgi:hypothetical protein
MIKKIITFISISFILLLVMMPINVKAAIPATEAIMDENGNFYFTTTDTAATTQTTWETIGFTVRRDECKDGNPLKDNKYATFMIKQNQKIEVREGGEVTVTFYLTKAQVNKALAGTDLETIKDNDVLYLNGIFKVHNGKNGAGPYYTLKSIQNAEAWKNPNDFKDRFNIKIHYNAGDQEYPIKISYQLYQSGKYTEVNTVSFGKQKNHTTFQLDKRKIPDRFSHQGEDYYLYRTYYQYLPKTTKLGNRKTSVDKNKYPEQYEKDLKYIRDRDIPIVGSNEGDSVKIVAVYRRYPKKSDNEEEEEIIKEYEETDPYAVIKADARGNEAYDVKDGIPDTESLYANAFGSKYLAGSTFIRKYGTKYYTVNVKKTYILHWTTTETETDPDTKETKEKTIEHTETRSMTYTYNIPREYSYWIIANLGVYGIEKADINNDALPNGSVTLRPSSGYSLPTVSYEHSDSESSHLIEPNKVIEVNLGTETINSSSIPSREYRDVAEAKVPQIKCKNDKLIFNGKTIMSDAINEKMTDTPGDIPSGLEEIGENVLYQANLVIPATKANREYESTGTLTFKPVAEINPDPVETVYELEINNVVVHTPTVCDAKIENNYKDNQMINPDKSRASLVLDRPFYVSLPTTGDHLYIKGYGYRDYGKYIESRQVKFPFDVYRGSSAEGTFIPKNTWTSVGENTQFYLPTWVNEGKYTVQFRSIAINAYANNGIDKTEALANEDLENYVATDTVNVEVSGRIYGFNLYDISDYPIWEDVFRTSGSLSLTGFKYTVGDKNQNGESNEHNSKYTLALVNGVHPKYSNVGALKTGYVTRFSLTTVGNMYGEKDYIRITPTFYHVDSKGENRQEVDIYYTETIKGKRKQLVKMGGILDFENKKALRTGDPYLSIPESELITTAAIEGMSIRDWKAQIRNIFTFTNIMLPKTLRTYIGNTRNLPSGVERSIAARSVQNWYGEYYLPSQVYVVPKGFDMMNYVTFNGGLRFKENFWIKDGYIIVNFNIETIQNEERHLSYINRENAKDGYCNMWKREGYQYQKTDYKGNTFHFQDGDYVLYYTDKSAAQDYISAGTH